jgi:hypothetical protein
MRRQAFLRWFRLALLVALLGLVALPATGISSRPLSQRFLNSLSQGPLIKYYVQSPNAAPASLAQGLAQARVARGRAIERTPLSHPSKDVFNRDTVGLPQNEESVAVCRNHPQFVLGGTNDYRGILDPAFNFTGWHFSTNGGKSVANEGLLPPAEGLASSGDPVDAADAECNLYAADLNFNTFSFGAGDNGVGLYRTTPATLESCPGGSDPSCWPTAKLAAVNEEGHFLDKPWMDVGASGDAGTVAWVTYTDYVCPDPSCEPVNNSIKAVRCAVDLSSCTAPIRVSEEQDSVQGSYVVVGGDGSTYVLWETPDTTFNDVPPGQMHIWLRVAPPGSLAFGPRHLVVIEDLNLGFTAHLHADDLRTAPLPKMAVKVIQGHPRVFAIWEGCQARPLDATCEEPRVKIRYSDDLGASWGPVLTISRGGDNYFPTIADDPSNRWIVAAYYTSRKDPTFHSRQNVEVDTIDAASGNVVRRRFANRLPNDTQADPLLGGLFIGDYFQVVANRGKAYVHYNANYRHELFFGVGLPVPQQDNYLTILHE